MRRIMLLVIVGLSVALSACSVAPSRNPFVEFVNYSESSLRDIPQECYRQVTHRYLLCYPNADFSFWVVAQNPLSLQVHNQGLNLTYDEVKKRLETEHRWQTKNTSPQVLSCWGEGTRHAAVFRRIAANRIQGEPLLVVGVTDGENELYSWDELEASLAELYSGGPTKLVLVGISQRVVDAVSPTLVSDLWERALQQAGATNLVLSHNAEKGYLISHTAELSDWAFVMPKRAKGGA